MRHFAFIALLALAQLATAQRMVSTVGHFTPPQSARSFTGVGGPSLTAPHHRSFFYPLAFFPDPFYFDSFHSAGYPAPSQPPVIILQQPSTPQPAPESPASPMQPLLIELQGDRYVQIGAEEPPTAHRIESSSAHIRSTLSTTLKATANQPLDPVVLVFRDGHHEQVSDYIIADGILYSRADYYTEGAWNKTIALSTLNLPETIATNQSHGICFHLPTAPNEVITRP